MKHQLFATTSLLVLVACSTTTQIPQEVEAVRDYVAAADLSEQKEMRTRQQISYTYLNDYFVIVSARQGDYLVEFERRCYELRRNDFTPEMVDERRNQNVLRAGEDTIRGCRIGGFYEITEEQVEELKALGDAPGDNVYMPDEE